MGTTIRPEISKKNRYWIDKHRYYELKHFCLQYPTWKKAYLSLDNVTDSQNGNVDGCYYCGYLRNPTAFKSRPIIKIYGFGSGELEIGDQVLEISSIDNYLVIDCEMMEIYKDKINCNSKVKLNRNDFPKLLPGLNRILFSGGITSVEVIPKWWTI